jgi:hypothetical protein
VRRTDRAVSDASENPGERRPGPIANRKSQIQNPKSIAAQFLHFCPPSGRKRKIVQILPLHTNLVMTNRRSDCNLVWESLAVRGGLASWFFGNGMTLDKAIPQFIN